MAWSTSSLADFWKMPTTSRVSAGFRFSKVRPVRVSTHSPAMKFLKILGFAPVPTLADVCSIVAIRLSSPANCKPSMLSGGWRLVIPTEDEGCVHHGGTEGTEKSYAIPFSVVIPTEDFNPNGGTCCSRHWPVLFTTR